MELYDKGEEKAFLELFKIFAIEKYQPEEDRIGILGMTPQDVSDLKAADKMRELFQQKYDQQAVCYGMGDGLEEIKKASSASKNIVVSPAALVAAQYLEKTFGTPYEISYPLAGELIPEMDYTGKKILVVHQQVIADSIRRELKARGAEIVQTASWFMMKKELQADGDVIDFTSRLFGLSSKEAALKLAEDFSISFDRKGHDPPQKRVIKRKISEEMRYRQAEQKCFRVLCDYLRLLERWKEEYAPKQPEDDWNPLFVEALHRQPYIEYLLDLLLSDSIEERAFVVAEYGKEVRKIEQRISEFIASHPAGCNERSRSHSAGTER